jgi:transposase
MAIGRPTKLTPEVQARILEALEAGSSQEGAANYAGIGRETFYSWMRRGGLGESPYADFADAVQKTTGALEIELSSVVRLAGKNGNWQAAMTMMERKWPERWGRREAPAPVAAANGAEADHKSQLERAKAVVAAIESAEVEA